jgi:hypothetical protein
MADIPLFIIEGALVLLGRQTAYDNSDPTNLQLFIVEGAFVLRWRQTT